MTPLLDRIFSGMLVGGLALAGCANRALAQTYSDANAPSSRQQWEQRIVERPPEPAYRINPRPASSSIDYSLSPNRLQLRGDGVPVRRVSAEMEGEPETIPLGTPVRARSTGVIAAVPDNMADHAAPGDVPYGPTGPTTPGPVPTGPAATVNGGPVYGPAYGSPVHGGAVYGNPGCASPDCGGPGCAGPCGPAGGDTYCDCDGTWGTPDAFASSCRAMRDFSFFGGVHGFKNYFDNGRQGDFGVQEGFNWGGPLGGLLLGDMGRDIGFQVGMDATQSNFMGDQAQVAGTVRGSDHDEVFVTAGFFHRAVEGGLQWGVVFDELHDVYYQTSDLRQIRSEVGLVNPCFGEVGFWSATNVGQMYVGNAKLTATDIYALYLRKYFIGGEGRIWGGLTEVGDGVIGGELHIPLEDNWALENSVGFTIPKNARMAGGEQQEAWSVSMQLVWYMGRSARCQLQSPFHPLQSVADNSVFLPRSR
jgi:hypothetical protein